MTDEAWPGEAKRNTIRMEWNREAESFEAHTGFARSWRRLGIKWNAELVWYGGDGLS